MTALPLPEQLQVERNTATIDHIKSRPECRTKEEHRSKANTVLSCHRCNDRRNNEYQNTLWAVQFFTVIGAMARRCPKQALRYLAWASAKLEGRLQMQEANHAVKFI